jgi:hypothetical protein
MRPHVSPGQITVSGIPAGGPQTPRSRPRKQDHQRCWVHAVEVCELSLLATNRARNISIAGHHTSWPPTSGPRQRRAQQWARLGVPGSFASCCAEGEVDIAAGWASARLTGILTRNRSLPLSIRRGVRHAATVPPSMASRFPNPGSFVLADLTVRAAGRLPGPVSRRIYTRIAASERISPRRLADVDLAASQTRLPSAIRSDAIRRYGSAAFDAQARRHVLRSLDPRPRLTAKANGAPQCTARESAVTWTSRRATAFADTADCPYVVFSALKVQTTGFSGYVRAA